MAATSLIHKITTGVPVNDEVGSIQNLLVDEQVKIIVDEGKPVTVRGVAAKLGDSRTERASVILDGLTAEGALVRFRAGFSNYYASPKVALTEKGPNLKAIVSDSLKSLFLSR
ncbi:MAG: hypothetical protein ACETVS_02805 [Dehalococcoidales bacterium]